MHAACRLSVENTGTAGIVGARPRRVAERNGAGRGPRGTPESPLHIKAPQKSIGKRRTNAKHVFFLVVECVWLVSE